MEQNNYEFDAHEAGQPDSSYHYAGDPHPERTYNYTNTETGYAADGAAPQKRHKIKKETLRRAGTRAASLVLVGAVAFAGGYAGNRVATGQSGRVIIQKAQTSLGSGAAGAAALSSSAVAASVAPTVVAITTEKMTTTNTWFGGQQIQSGAGSGVIISEDGYILTCAHVIDGADSIKVELSDGTSYDATLVGSYTDGDIAVVKVNATGLHAAVIGDSANAQLGEMVYAVGNPEGTLSGTITDGIISSLHREITVQVESSSGNQNRLYPGMGNTAAKNITLNCIQMSASVSPGNSGGGLFNAKGELIGIVNAKSSATNSEGLGFAIPVDDAMKIATSLINDGSYTDPAAQAAANGPKLGITAVYLDESSAKSAGYTSAGVYVYTIASESTKKSGLAVGDRIISVDDSVISALTDIAAVLNEKSVGDTVRIAVERDGQMQTYTVTLVAPAD